MKARIPKNIGGGGAQNMNQMIKQAQKMQDEITALQEDIEARDFTATAGGGAVEVTINGKRNVLDLKISPDIVDKDAIEDLQDIIKAAFNAAVDNLDEVSDAEMQKLTGGVSFPGLF